jgi:hypothetical protein
MATGVYDATPVGVMPATGQKIALDTRRIAEWLVRGVVFALYALLFLFTLVALGFIEIRQTNMTAFNSLIATLEQRDAYRRMLSLGTFDALLTTIRSQHDDAQNLLKNLDCPKSESAAFDQTTTGASAIENAAGAAAVADGCSKLRNDLQQHLFSLTRAQDEILIKRGTLEQYYMQYRDGITQQAAQIIPALRFLDGDAGAPPWVIPLARSSFEITAMVLLVCMGALGGVISLTRCFVEKNLPNPAIPELFYKPAMGAVVALGIYVLFRATQLFFTGSGQTEGTASTSIFVLAALGLASGVCASDAIGQIEYLAARVLRRSGQVSSPQTSTESAPLPLPPPSQRDPDHEQPAPEHIASGSNQPSSARAVPLVS